MSDALEADGLGVFLKAPLPGLVKTRLAASIGSANAVRVYRAMAADVLEMAFGLSGVRLRVFYAPSSSFAACKRLVDEAHGERPAASRPRQDVLEPQAGQGDLGRRILAALETMLESASRAVLVGTDLPTLTGGRILAAYERLRKADVVFGPAADGGYYLVGVREIHPRLFEQIPWSTPSVLPASLQRCRELGLSVALLPEERDVDSADDLLELAESLARPDSPGLAVRTRAVCAELFAGPGPNRTAVDTF